MTWVRYIENTNGDLAEIEHYCSAYCMENALGAGSSDGSYCPRPEETDYDRYCPACGIVSVPAINYWERTARLTVGRTINITADAWTLTRWEPVNLRRYESDGPEPTSRRADPAAEAEKGGPDA